MLNIRGMSTVEDLLTGVNRFGQGLTRSWTFSWLPRPRDRTYPDPPGFVPTTGPYRNSLSVDLQWWEADPLREELLTSDRSLEPGGSQFKSD